MPSRLANHEAAHVVAVLAFRLELLDVRIDAHLGRVRFVGASTHDDRRGYRIIDAAVALSGRAADGTSDPLSLGDRETIQRCRLDASERRAAENLARRIVEGNRGAIDAIAEYLDRRTPCVVEGSLIQERFGLLIQKA